MALTITYDGYGVVANADATTNDTSGSGTGDGIELCGGSYSLSPDPSRYSIASKHASKSGYTYIEGLKVEDASTDLYGDIATWAEDYINRVAGMFQSRGQTCYSISGLSVHNDTANTSVSADGSNIEHEKSERYITSWVASCPTTANVITVAATGGNTCDVTK